MALVHTFTKNTKSGAIPPEYLRPLTRLADEDEDIPREHVVLHRLDDDAPERVVVLAHVAGGAVNEDATPGAEIDHEATLRHSAATSSSDRPGTRAPPGKSRQ